ncbi:hypothetical protein PPERSA_08639 [Pseudocohnilembus persalinus]|uniref:Transmembrane protein n=1 Tax=Pseudocohnilembus persalinus TaxID=266149 RepID=A0A0V0R568_PSEPJ|nr:hypothetical protein PPERSA_08639 [Pseudocohnilembus persalinus]|eukprot:KRX09607.1 hypothetical protein PPERSA_08639 [Pseudocohnilembus persalinus]
MQENPLAQKKSSSQQMQIPAPLLQNISTNNQDLEQVNMLQQQKEGSKKSLRRQKTENENLEQFGGKPIYHPIIMQANYLANKPSFYTPAPGKKQLDEGDILRKRYIICQSTQIFIYLVIQLVFCILCLVHSKKTIDALDQIAQENKGNEDLTDSDQDNLDYLKKIINAIYGIAQYRIEGYYDEILDVDEQQSYFWKLCYAIFWSSIFFFFMLIVLPFGSYPQCIYKIPEKKNFD